MAVNRKATISDVAELAGVSIKTVSRVANQEANVRESTRSRVEEAIAQLDYRPNMSARSLAGHRSKFIVLVYDDPSAYEDPSSGYIVRLQQGALTACRNQGYELLIHPYNYQDYTVHRELTGLIARARPDGIILAAPLSNMSKFVSTIGETGTPYVCLSPGEEYIGPFAVATNDQDISAAMTRYLASLGHVRIAFITGDPNHSAVATRLLGYQDGLQQCGLEFSEHFVVAGDNSIASGEAAAAELLARPQRPTAIFAANDDMAAGVMRVADRMNIAVPGQLSVAGFDDNSLARQIHPSLTTIRQPLSKMAERAAQALISHFGQDLPTEGTEVFPASLQIRESTGPVPG